jgi:hypothetical protein
MDFGIYTKVIGDSKTMMLSKMKSMILGSHTSRLAKI